ncbi:MAG TPA: NAD-dependent epimerase/dehydratase family protein [Bacteroidales bacterium]|nr:NAD-dependent epimerase/dehydratase family protein [Bacteroidales bacterium]
MKALVTGGGGFIGSALVHALIKRSFRVTSFSRADYPELKKIGAEVKRGDLSDMNAVLNACEGMDIVFHVAAKAGTAGDYKNYYMTNVTGTENIIHACNVNNIKRLIYTSSASVVFDGKSIEGSNESLPYPSRPLSYYTATKAIAEQLILKANSSSLKTLALRPHIVYGPGDNHLFPRIIQQAKTGKLRQIGDGKNLIDVSYIDNVVAAHLNAAQAIKENPEVAGKAYFITNGEPVLLWDFLNRILAISDLEPLKKSFPTWAALLFSALTEALHKTILINREPMLTRFLVRELSRSHWFDISSARRLLNYNPVVSNIEGLKKLTNKQSKLQKMRD